MKPDNTGLKAPEGKFLVVAFQGDSNWSLGVFADIREAEEVAHEERCVGVDIEIYDDEGRTN